MPRVDCFQNLYGHTCLTGSLLLLAYTPIIAYPIPSQPSPTPLRSFAPPLTFISSHSLLFYPASFPLCLFPSFHRYGSLSHFSPVIKFLRSFRSDLSRLSFWLIRFGQIFVAFSTCFCLHRWGSSWCKQGWWLFFVDCSVRLLNDAENWFLHLDRRGRIGRWWWKGGRRREANL